jgi:hypothetical protein
MLGADKLVSTFPFSCGQSFFGWVARVGRVDAAVEELTHWLVI